MSELVKDTFNSCDYYNIIDPDLKSIKQTLACIEKQVSKINRDEDIPTMKSRITVLINDMERLAVKGRSIPLFTEREEYEQTGDRAVKINFERNEDILDMEIPLLLPKKKVTKTNKSYLVNLFHGEFQSFFRNTDFSRYEEPVIIWFEFQYKKRIGKQGFRDHDNLETKIVKDMLIPYLVVDDNPSYCDDFNSSKTGDYDATFIHVVPRQRFARYYADKVEKNESIS